MRTFVINEKKYLEELVNSDIFPEKTAVETVINHYILYYYNYVAENKENVVLKDLTNYILEQMSKYKLKVENYQEYLAKMYIETRFKDIKDGRWSIQVRETDTIDIYKSEIDIINQCETEREKKLLFTIYVLAKYERKYGWVYTPTTDIFKLANISLSLKDKNIFLGKMKRKGYCKDTKRIDKDITGVNLAENYSEDDTIEIRVSEIKNLGNLYLAYKREGYKQCEECGKLIKIKSKTYPPKYCDSCAKDMHSKDVMRSRKRNEGKRI